MPSSLEHLLAPVTADRLTLRNRVVMPAHTTNFATDGCFSEQHVAYHRERAAGGVGLIVTEGMRVHPTSLGRPSTVAAFDDAVIPSLAALAGAVQREGAKLAAQILHVGRQAGGHNSLGAAWGASALPWSGTAAIPHEMTRDEIGDVVNGFGAAAARVEAAGVDAIEIHLGHGHLLQQFLSPASNHRTDAYGGDTDRRLRFTREAFDAVVASVSDRMPIMVRISGDEFVDGGLGLDDMLAVVEVLLAEYRIDVLHVSHSAYLATGSVATQIADMSFPTQPYRHLPRAFARAFPDVAVMAVCRLDTLEAAAEIVADGDADLVALARPHIATPDLVHRAEARLRNEPVAPRHDCIACNQGCTARLELGLPISCVVNPEAGLEREWQTLRSASARRSGASSAPGDRRSVLVVGGGPAGLNAAVAAAESGHQVVLRERATELGGALRLAAALPARNGFALMIDQLHERARHAGVQIELGRPLLRDELLGRDDVVVATGGSHRHVGDAGLNAVSLPDLIADPARGGSHLVVVDEEGSWTALGLADRHLRLGGDVTLLCAQPMLAWRIPVYSKPALLDRLRGGRFAARLLTAAVRRTAAGLVCRDVMSGRESLLPGVTAVAVVRPPRPRLSLVDAVRAAGAMAHVVGDAYAPRSALEAAFEGRRTGYGLSTAHDGVARATTILSGRL